ncbi:hypothetical protein H8959_020799 [Pygathrix nigripes]
MAGGCEAGHGGQRGRETQCPEQKEAEGHSPWLQLVGRGLTGAGPGGGGAGGTWVRSRGPAPSHFRVPRRRSPKRLQPRSPERPPAPARRAEARATPHWPLGSSQSAPRRSPSARAEEPPPPPPPPRPLAPAPALGGPLQALPWRHSCASPSTPTSWAPCRLRTRRTSPSVP